jgi:hypothetical protein
MTAPAAAASISASGSALIILAFVAGLLVGGLVATVLLCACVWGQPGSIRREDRHG